MVEIFEREPTPEEIAEREAWAAGAYDRAYAQVEQERKAAYSQESDPLMAQYLRDEATKEEWLAKVAEIKERLPYPDPADFS